MADALTDPVLALAVPMIAEFEGFRSAPYRDVGGVYTIGYGFTVLENGHAVTAETPPMDQDAAYARLIRMVAAVAVKVGEIVHRPLEPHQTAALVSFAYNCGTGALRSSTMLTLIERGQIAEAANQFSSWVYAGGHVVPGLERRRAAEKAMFLNGATAAAVSADSSSNSDQTTAPEMTSDALNAAEMLIVKGGS